MIAKLHRHECTGKMEHRQKIVFRHFGSHRGTIHHLVCHGIAFFRHANHGIIHRGIRDILALSPVSGDFRFFLLPHDGFILYPVSNGELIDVSMVIAIVIFFHNKCGRKPMTSTEPSYKPTTLVVGS